MKYSLILCLIFITQSQPEDRTVNVAIETSFQFEPKDINNEAGIVTNLKSVIDKIYSSLIPAQSPTFRITPNAITLSQFLIDFGSNLLNLTDADMHNVASILNKQLQQYKTASNSFRNIFYDPILRKHLRKTLRYWSSTEPKQLKNDLQKLMRTGDPELHKLIQALGTFYTEKDLEKFYSYAKKLEKNLHKKKDSRKLIKDWLDFSIFDRYNSLNNSYKMELFSSMKLLLDYFNEETVKPTEIDVSPMSAQNEKVENLETEIPTHEKHPVLRGKTYREHGPRNLGQVKENYINKTTYALQLIEKLLNNDLLNNLQLYLTDKNKAK